MSSIKKANFFIVGAPKCGTTALTEYLKEHPNIFLTNPKEPHFFATDMPRYRCCNNIDEFNKLFNNANKNVARLGEASVWYLYSKDAIENIYNYNSKSKIIVMLRRPDEMVYSMHSQHLISSDEDVIDFETAYYLEKFRRNGKFIPRNCREIKNLYYKEIAKYGKQLDNLFYYFPKEQVKIIFFEDFKANTKKVFNDTIHFLNLKKIDKTEFDKVNQNTRPKIFWLNKLIKRQPKFIDLPKRYIKAKAGINSLKIRKLLTRFNTIKELRRPLPYELKCDIINNYLEDIERLEVILDVDLEDWKTQI